MPELSRIPMMMNLSCGVSGTNEDGIQPAVCVTTLVRGAGVTERRCREFSSDDEKRRVA